MLAVVIVLAVTNVVTLVMLMYWRLRAAVETVEDPEVAAALAALAPIPATIGRPRRFISVEVLNPIELARTRGRVLGIAGSLAPGLTNRLVYDQVVREMRRLFRAQRVVADVHVHAVHPTPATAMPGAATPPAVPAPSVTQPSATAARAPERAEPEPHTIEIAPGVIDDVDERLEPRADDQRPA